jgi:excisionase family DNA binding protein
VSSTSTILTSDPQAFSSRRETKVQSKSRNQDPFNMAGDGNTRPRGHDPLAHPIEAESEQTAEESYGAPFNILIALRSVRHLMSADEVASLLGNSKFTVYRMVRRNQIPHMMIAGSLRFDPSALELWLIKKQPDLAVAARRLTLAA